MARASSGEIIDSVSSKELQLKVGEQRPGIGKRSAECGFKTQNNTNVLRRGNKLIKE